MINSLSEFSNEQIEKSLSVWNTVLQIQYKASVIHKVLTLMRTAFLKITCKKCVCGGVFLEK